MTQRHWFNDQPRKRVAKTKAKSAVKYVTRVSIGPSSQETLRLRAGLARPSAKRSGHVSRRPWRAKPLTWTCSELPISASLDPRQPHARARLHAYVRGRMALGS